jgi:hypothetical protein
MDRQELTPPILTGGTPVWAPTQTRRGPQAPARITTGFAMPFKKRATELEPDVQEPGGENPHQLNQ